MKVHQTCVLDLCMYVVIARVTMKSSLKEYCFDLECWSQNRIPKGIMHKTSVLDLCKAEALQLYVSIGLTGIVRAKWQHYGFKVLGLMH